MVALTVCPTCSEPAPDGANWCEACGADLAAEPGPACVACGERSIAEDGYCMSCGHKQPGERDHVVVEAGVSVAVSDRGLRHVHNEDAAAVGELADGGTVLVVCDGVSSTPGSAEASLAAANAARDLLIAELDPTPDRPTDEPADEAITAALDRTAAALVAATEVAQAEAAASPEVESNAPYATGGPPSSTFVAAVGRPTEVGAEISVAWLGDSRAYWIDDDVLQLTEDHEIGGSLTRWLGADSFDAVPDVSHHVASGPGRLLLCTDGMWRYADDPTALGDLIERLTSETDSDRDLAAALVDFAKDGGGHDNITVAVWSAGGATSAVESGKDGGTDVADDPPDPAGPEGSDSPDE